MIGAGAAESFAAESVHPLVRSWYADEALLANCRDWLAGELRLAGDVEAVRAFRARFPVGGTTDDDYVHRVVAVGDGLEAVAGIRYRLDSGEFFVDLVAASRPLADAAELTAIARRLGAEFSVFRPAWMRFYAADERLAAAGRLAGDFVLAARVDDLRAGAAASSDAVSLRRASATNVYDHYLRLYQAFHAEHPRNEELSHVEDIETLADFEEDGGLFEIRVDGMFAGFCGARRWPRYGVRGWVGGEIILANRFRGHGHAASAHVRMAEAIPAAVGDAIWAEVHEDNAPSFRAGLRAGYAVIGRVLRVPVA